MLVRRSNENLYIKIFVHKNIENKSRLLSEWLWEWAGADFK